MATLAATLRYTQSLLLLLHFKYTIYNLLNHIIYSTTSLCLVGHSAVSNNLRTKHRCRRIATFLPLLVYGWFLRSNNCVIDSFFFFSPPFSSAAPAQKTAGPNTWKSLRPFSLVTPQNRVFLYCFVFAGTQVHALLCAPIVFSLLLLTRLEPCIPYPINILHI